MLLSQHESIYSLETDEEFVHVGCGTVKHCPELFRIFPRGSGKCPWAKGRACKYSKVKR